jgi:2-keto-4-pentenoate hydratase/2-oxohepta-3-ene-1,7-dioic acid hydratase in catechol pathway
MEKRVELAARNGRAQLISEGKLVDVEIRSNGHFPADPMGVLQKWEAFCAWSRSQQPESSDPALDETELGPCVPRPGQVFAIGLNYSEHAAEAGREAPEAPMVFTKFPSCLNGPRSDIPLASDTSDWEVELVVVIGKGGYQIPEGNALERVAGYCVGQDISDRRLQFSGNNPQFSLAKSARGYGPIGPAVVSIDSLENPLNLEIQSHVNGERMQHSRTRNMIHPVPRLVAYLSERVTLRPGDLIFTGTPSGVGSVRDPRIFLKPGDVIRSEIEALGVLENRCV